MTEDSGRPADHLAGLDLGNGWKVIEQVSRTPAQSGGCFSTGYIVENEDSKKAFLKAIDFSSVLQSEDSMRSLENITKTYNFERDILNKCKDKRLSRIILPILDGSIVIPGFGQLINRVHYIVFELAAGDIRKVLSETAVFDIAFCLRSLHNTAVGINQLHKSGIAHQDLKPSNVLVTGKNQTKISDLGRSSDLATPFVNDNYSMPGDPNYAPPEQMYGYRHHNDFTDRQAADLYHLGSLFFFFFTGASARQATLANILKINGPNFQLRDFDSDIPVWEQAYEETLKDLRTSIEIHLGTETDDAMALVRQLCNPHPINRGHRVNIKTRIQQYGLDRFISQLDILSTRAELRMK